MDLGSFASFLLIFGGLALFGAYTWNRLPSLGMVPQKLSPRRAATASSVSSREMS